MTKYTYLMLGQVFKTDELKNFDYWDEKWLPYIEGHEGTNIRFIRGEEPNDSLFIGKIYASTSGAYETELIELKSIPNLGDVLEVTSFLQTELEIPITDLKLLFFDVIS